MALIIQDKAVAMNENEAEYQIEKAIYWDDIQRGIDQIAQGRGIEREIIEVDEYGQSMV